MPCGTAIFFTFSHWLVHFNRFTNKNVDGMKLIELLWEGIPANLFTPSACGSQSLPRTHQEPSADSSRAFRGLIKSLPRTRGWETLT